MSERVGPGWVHPVSTPLHVGALLGLGISQPLLDLVAGHPGFLAAHGLAGAELLTLALVVAWLPAAVVALPVSWLLSRRSGVATTGFTGLVLLVCLAVVGLGFASRVVSTVPLAAVLATSFCIATFLLYRQFSEVRFMVSVLAAVLIVAPGAFLASDSVSRRWFPQEETPPPPPVENPQPVFILLFDAFPGWIPTTPDLELDAERFPNLAALASVSDYFPWVFASAEGTRESIPSLLSGVHLRGESEETASRCAFLSRLTTSYHLQINEIVTDLAPKASARLRREGEWTDVPRDLTWIYLHWLLPGSLRERLAPIDTQWSGFGTRPKVELLPAAGHDAGDLDDADVDEVTDVTVPRFGRFLRALHRSESGRPPFVFHHSEVPHSPWRLLPSGQTYSVPSPRSERDVFWHDEWFLLEARARKEMQTRAVDQLVRRFIERLRALDLFESSWVIVTSDHAEVYKLGAFSRASEYEHLSAMLSVPLWIKRPGQDSSRRFESYVELVDLAPTLAEALGFALPCDPDGRNLFGDSPKAYAESVSAKVFGYPEGSMEYLESAFRDESRGHRRKLGLDPPSDTEPGAYGLYGLGPYGILVGRDAPDDGPTLPFVLEVEGPDADVTIDPEAAVVPARIFGKVHGLAKGEHVFLALAQQGRIVATTRSRNLFAEEIFSGIADPALLRPGRFDLEAFAVRGPPSRPELSRLEWTTRDARARRVVAEAGRVVLEQGGSHGFDALMATMNVDDLDTGDSLSFSATNANPMLEFEMEAVDSTEVVIEIDLTVPAESEIQFWYQTEGEPNYVRTQVRRVLVGPGRNQKVLKISAEERVGRNLRIDPGIGIGPYVLHSLTVRESQPR